MFTALVTALAVAGTLAAAPALVDSRPSAAPGFASPDERVVTVPAAVTHDCSADVTGALTAWIASVPDGSTLVLDGQGCYRVDYTLRLTDRHDIALDGQGANLEARMTFPAAPKLSRAMIDVVGGSAITIKNLTLQGTNHTADYNSAREWYHAIGLEGVAGAMIDNVTATNIWGDFVHIAQDARAKGAEPPSSDVTIQGSTTNVIGRNQISCTACERVVVQNNSFSNTGYQVFDIEVQAATWHASDVAFQNNTISGRVPLSVLVSGGIGDYVRDITFTGNTMLSAPLSCQPPIYILDTEPAKSDFVFENNKLKTLSAAGRIYGVSGVTFADNFVELVPGGGCQEPGTAIRAAGSDGTVARNHFPGFARVLPSGIPTPPGQTVCGNRLNGDRYDLPVVCTPIS